MQLTTTDNIVFWYEVNLAQHFIQPSSGLLNPIETQLLLIFGSPQLRSQLNQQKLKGSAAPISQAQAVYIALISQ